MGKGKSHKGKNQNKKKGRGPLARNVYGKEMRSPEYVKRNRRIMCSQCGRKFRTEHKLEKHMSRSRRNVIVTFCNKCGKYHQEEDDCVMGGSSEAGPSKVKDSSDEEEHYNAESNLDNEHQNEDSGDHSCDNDYD